MTGPTLTDFLLARIAEDEEIAKASTPGPWHWERGTFTSGRDAGMLHNAEHWVAMGCGYDDGDIQTFAEGDPAHIARHDPVRVLAECEAKRRIVDAHTDAWGMNLHSMWGADMRGGLGLALRALALPYADHPDYLQEWKP